MVLDSVAERLYEPAQVYLYLPKPVDIRNPFLMSPLLSHPGFAFLVYIAVSRASMLLHRLPRINACMFCCISRSITGTVPAIGLDPAKQTNMNPGAAYGGT